LLLVSQVHVHGWGLESRNTVAGKMPSMGGPARRRKFAAFERSLMKKKTTTTEVCGAGY
jgi:hypothetical protein